MKLAMKFNQKLTPKKPRFSLQHLAWNILWLNSWKHRAQKKPGLMKDSSTHLEDSNQKHSML